MSCSIASKSFARSSTSVGGNCASPRSSRVAVSFAGAASLGVSVVVMSAPSLLLFYLFILLFLILRFNFFSNIFFFYLFAIGN